MLKTVFPINGHLHIATNYQILLNKLVLFSFLIFFLSLVGKPSYLQIFFKHLKENFQGCMQLN